MKDRTIIKNIEEFLKTLTKVPNDKLLHFFYGYIIFNSLTIFMAFIPALIIITVIAISKEVYDFYVPGHESSYMDAVYGIAPGVVQTLIGL